MVIQLTVIRKMVLGHWEQNQDLIGMMSFMRIISLLWSEKQDMQLTVKTAWIGIWVQGTAYLIFLPEWHSETEYM